MLQKKSIIIALVAMASIGGTIAIKISPPLQNKEIEILVDFHAFQRDIIEIISRKIADEYKNKYLLFPSGDYNIYIEAFIDFHKSFEEAKIKRLMKRKPKIFCALLEVEAPFKGSFLSSFFSLIFFFLLKRSEPTKNPRGEIPSPSFLLWC